MKRVLAVISTITAAVTLSTPAMAVFQSQKIRTVPASVTVGGAAVADFTHSIRNVANVNQTATTIGWTNAQRSDGWKIAAQLIRLQTNVSAGGVRIYTDNTAADASPKFVDETPDPIDDGGTPLDPTDDIHNLDSNPAGLVRQDNPSETLPLAWRSKGVPANVGVNLLAADPNSGPAAGPGYRFQWLFMEDRGKPNIDLNGDGDILIDPANPNAGFDVGEQRFIYDQPKPFNDLVDHRGLHFEQGDNAFLGDEDSDNVSYVYLEANFGIAGAGGVYSTNKITIEAYLE